MSKSWSALLRHLLFIDIETIAGEATFRALSSRMQKHWEHKARFIRQEERSADEVYEDKAAIYAEFGKVICIGMGYIQLPSVAGDPLQLRVKTRSGHDEKQLLESFNDVLKQRFDPKKVIFCAHNGKEFDYPYLCRRMLVHGLPLPEALQLSGKKPWEVRHLDTLELWKFGDYKHFTALDLLAAVLGVESSKSDLDGSMVNEAYYKYQGLERIARYCSEDVAVLAKVYLKLAQIAQADPVEVVYA